MATLRKSKGTVLITGGAIRIGQSIAIECANQGYDIALHYHRSDKQAKKTAQEIKQLKRQCTLFQCDLQNQWEANALISIVSKECKNLNTLINNASVFKKSNLRNLKDEDIDRDLNVHLKSPLILIRDFADHVKRGNIINILDTHITSNNSAHFSYLLAKKSLSSLTQMAAVELAPDIRVNAIAPGLILPPTDQNNDYLNRLAKKIPLKRKGNMKNITQSITYLLNNDYLTGQILFNDGGEHLID